MADVNANIGINFDTSQALAQLRQLQAGLSRFNQTLTQGNVAAMNAQKGLNSQLMQAINATGKFVATQKDVASSTSSFTQSLEKNQLSMRQYFRYTAAAATQNTKVFKGMFAQERETLTRASKDRVKLLQSQYIQLQAANGNMIKTLQVIPKHLKMVNGQYADYATRMQMAAQRQQFLNKLLSQGSTQLLNFGKNTQWAGRQLMVGLTIPLTILGSTAAKTFMEMEQAVTKFSRVYGDMTTGNDATNRAIADIQLLAKEFTKYGIAVKDTVEMAATAAAMGLTGGALNAQVIQATRLAVLGQVEQQQALETTISLTNAFGIASEDLAKKINFLNAVENQTVLSIEDLTIAVPKAGPVIRQLGGSVEDLAFFMTAMKEGGINASEGANALKSGLASMINPSKKASEFLAELGINITGIVNANAGDLKGTVIGFARALDTLDPLNRARAIEQMFGKFQFARLSTLFQNITKDGSQASRALGLAGASVEELAILSERELGKVEDMTGAKFKKSMENLKLQLIPIGKAFLQAVTPIVNFVGRILEKFNTLSDGTKKVVTVIIGVIGGLAPVALMTFGVLMNAVANGIKLFAKLRGGIAQLNGSNNVLGGGFEYLTNEQIENVAQANALHTSHSQLISTFNVEAASVQALAAAYQTAASQARALAQSSPGLFNTVPGPAGAVAGLPPTKFATGGVVPGKGNKDTVPAMLTPGEVVLSKDMVKNNPELIAGIMNGTVKKYAQSTNIEGGGFSAEGLAERAETMKALYLGTGSDGFDQRVRGLIEGSISTGKAGVKRIIEFARASGEEIVESQTEAMNRWRSAMLDEADAALAAVPDRNAGKDPIKEFLKSRALGSSNAFDTLDTHGNQNDAPTFAHTETSNVEPYEEALDMAKQSKTVSKRMRLIQGGADWANNLPDSDPRKPTTPITPEFRPVSAAGFEGIKQTTNTDLNYDRANVAKFVEEFSNLDPITKWSTSLENAGYDVDANAEKVRALDAVYEEHLRRFAAKNKTGVMGDSDLMQIREDALNDPRVDPTIAAAARRSSNNVSGIRMSGVDKDQEKMIMDAYANGEIPLPEDITSVPKNLFPKPGSAIGGEAGRKKRLGVFDQAEEDRLAPLVEVTPEAEADAEAEGEKIGKAATRGVKKGAKTQSPSTDGIEVGKDIAEGVVIGLQEGEASVASQGAQLGSSAVPKKPRSAAETQARVDKMDLDNKAFYDDLDTPEFRDERQVLKSLDRQRRKRGATGTVGGGPATPPVPGPSSLTVASTARTEAAAADLAVNTEQAATAQAQVVQQIHDESKSRVTIKGNTINIGKAREDADRLSKEASDAEAAAAKIRTEAAKWEEIAAREKGKNMQTAENAKALKKQADEAEIRAAEARIKAAEAEIIAAELENGDGAVEQIIQDPVKTPAKVKKAEEIMSNGTVEAGDGMRRIVEGTDDTADSTLLVADQTDEVAEVTGDIIPAQTENLDNVITTASLNDAIVKTTGDIHGSTIDTAMSQEEIVALQEQEQVLREQLNANLRRQSDAVLSGSDLSPTGKKRLTEQQALDEAFGRDPGKNGPDDAGQKGYTRNKKGEILFDPETGQPTTMDEKQITKKKRGMRKEKVGKFSGKAAGALGTATMVAGMVGAPPQVTAALGTAATVAQFAPMLAGMGPVGLAITAIAAVGVGLMVLNKRLQASYDAQAKFVRETSASTKKMAEIGAITGKVGASEIMAKKRATGTTRDYIVRERAGSSFGDTFMQSDTGKAMSKTLQANITKSGAKEAAETFATEIAAYVQDGVLTAEQAQDIAYQIGVNFKDTSLGIKVDANLSALIGPNGEDLAKDPMVIGMRLVQSAERGSLNSVKSIDEAKSHGLSGAVEAADLGAREAVAMQMAQMQADAVARRYDDEIRALEAQVAQTKNKQEQIKLEDKLTALKEKAYDAESQMNNMVANQTDMAMQRFTEEIQHQSVVWDAVTLGLYKLWGAGNQREAAYTQALNGAITDKYANTEQATQAATVSDRLAKYADGKTLGFGTNNYEDAGFTGGGKEAQQFEVKMKLLMANGTLTPNQTTAMLDLFEGNLPRLETVLDIGTRMHGASATAEIIMLLTNFQDKEYAQKIALEVTTQDNESFKKLSDIFGLAAQLDGKEINMEVVVTEVGGVAGLEYYIERLDELETKIKGLKGKPITQEDVAQFTKDTNVKVDDGFLDYVNTEFKGDGKKQADAIRAYTLVYKQIMSMDYASEEARDYFRSQAGQMAVDKLNELRKAGTAPADIETYIKQQTEIEIDALITKVKVDPAAVAGTKTETYLGTKPVVDSKTGPNGNKDGGTKKEDPLAFLDSLAMRIKMVRDQAFNAKKPIESMLAAFNSPAAKKNVANMFKLFDGLQQKLIALKVPEEFRDYIAGLDAQQLEDLKKADLDKKKKGQQGIFLYGEKKDKDGKTVKDKKGNVVYDTSRIVGISKEGKAIMAAYNEAPLDKFNIAQRKVVTDTDMQFKAFNKLKAAGIDTGVALETVSDSILAASIASSALQGTDLKIFIDDLKKSASAAEKAAVMADLLKKNADFKFKKDTFPKLASSLKIAGLSAENIATVLQDPALAKQLMADLEDGKIDSKAIADYLNSIKEEKIVEIRGKFNAGDFAAAAAPGMELVNKMFATQEALIRTGIDGRSQAMVARLKDLKEVNENLQLDIQKITFNQIRPIEKAIETATRNLEIQVTRRIEVFQEEISDLQRVIEIAFERPIAAISAENTIMSNDMEIMNHAAEEINKRYDEQAEALSKVSEIKSRLVEQEQEQLDLADALSKGDIGAAARAIQSIRAAQAARNAENASKALELSRKNKIDNLRGRDSGLTKSEITERQYQNAQAVYDLENRVTTEVNGKLMTRLQILDDIKNKSDEIYKLEEDREARQLAIRALEDKIYDINEKQIKPKQDIVDANALQIAIDEDAMQNLVDSITVLGKTKDVWDGISAKIEASSLAGQDFDGLMGTMLASVDEIDKGWKSIENTLSKYSSATAAGPGTDMDTIRQEFKTSAAALDAEAKVKADAAEAAFKAAEAQYKINKDLYELELKAIQAAKDAKSWWLADMLQNGFNQKWKDGAPVAPERTSTAADNPNVDYNDPTKNAANDIYKTGLFDGKTTSNAGGKSSTTGTGGTTGGGTTGGGTTGGTTDPVPSPGQTTPPVVNNPPGGVKKNTNADTAAGTAMTREEGAILQMATPKRLQQLKDIAINRPKFALSNMKIKYGTNTKDSDTYKELKGEKRTSFDTDYAAYEALKKEADKWTTTDGGYTTSYADSSSAGMAEEARLLKLLPDWVQKAVALIDKRDDLLKTDYSQFRQVRDKYYDAKDEMGIGANWSFKDIEAYKPFMDKYGSLYKEYRAIHSKLQDTNNATDLARNNLLKAGYSEANLGWAFKSGTSSYRFTDQTPKGFIPSYDFKYYSKGGSVASMFAQSGISLGTDTVPAMLTPGEFVMSKFAVQSHGTEKMKAINNGSSVGDAVYNYSISVNVKSESNPDEIARTVIAQIKSVDAQKMRGVRT